MLERVYTTGGRRDLVLRGDDFKNLEELAKGLNADRLPEDIVKFRYQVRRINRTDVEKESLSAEESEISEAMEEFNLAREEQEVFGSASEEKVIDVVDALKSVYSKAYCEMERSLTRQIEKLSEQRNCIEKIRNEVLKSTSVIEIESSMDSIKKIIVPADLLFKVGDKIKDLRNGGDDEGVILKITDEGYECQFDYGRFLITFKEQYFFGK
jgi:hypothetical protein